MNIGEYYLRKVVGVIVFAVSIGVAVWFGILAPNENHAIKILVGGIVVGVVLGGLIMPSSEPE